MSVADVTARIHQIEGRLAALTGTPGGPTSVPAPAGSDFAQALADATPAPEASATGRLPAPASPARPAGSATGQAVVGQARRYLGVPYVWGGTNPATGLDCSGLVQLVYKNLGIELPRVSYDQATVGRPVPDLAHAQPGDILCFGSPADHVAIYIGHHQMIEAPHTGSQVRVSDVYKTPSAIRRVVASAPAASPAPASARIAGTAAGSPTPYAALFQQAQQRYGVPASLLAAVAEQESGFDPGAVSSAGAQGLMQLMPSTAATLGVDPTDPSQAVDGAARLLRDLIGEFGRTDLALAAYNAGPGAVHRYQGIPPYPETQRYVSAVLADQAALEAR